MFDGRQNLQQLKACIREQKTLSLEKPYGHTYQFHIHLHVGQASLSKILVERADSHQTIILSQ